MREAALKSHPFRKVREKDGAPRRHALRSMSEMAIYQQSDSVVPHIPNAKLKRALSVAPRMARRLQHTTFAFTFICALISHSRGGQNPIVFCFVPDVYPP